MTTIGVLAIQGDVSEHCDMIKRVGATPMPVRRPYELELVDGLIIPGGESTTLGLLLKQIGLDAAIQKRAKEGMPVLGTCMGAILMAKKLTGNAVDQSTDPVGGSGTAPNEAQPGRGSGTASPYGGRPLSATSVGTLGLMNICARRNAYGRQRESFEEEVPIPALNEKAFPCVFIRAPWFEEVGPGVEVLAAFQGKPVLVREGNLMASAFHPEISKDARLHQYFLGFVRERGLKN